MSFTVKEFSKPIIYAIEHFTFDHHSHEYRPDSLTLFQIDFADMLNSLPGAVMAKKFGK